jgi:glycosyltransferase involved in cell wall biosynthesis
MKIAIEALGIHDYGGGRSATLNLAQNLLAIDQQNEYTLILNQAEPDLVARNLQQVILPLKNRFLARLAAQIYLMLKGRQFNLIHHAKNLGIFGPSAPTAITIYDMTTLIHPQLFPPVDVWYWQHIQPRTLKNAARIIAISQTTKDDILGFYPLAARKIDVVYPTIAPRFRPGSRQDCQRIRRRYGLPDHYLLHVGRLDRKKDINIVIEAFAEYTHSIHPGYGGKLVIVGGHYAKSQAPPLGPTLERLGVQDQIIFSGRIPDADLPAMYSGAQIAILASRHEGFGLAAVEALACGTPLIANHSGAIPEVVGEAALLIKNIDSPKLAQAIHDLLSNPRKHKDNQQRGLDQARKYQNVQDAEQTLACYQAITNFDKDDII